MKKIYITEEQLNILTKNINEVRYIKTQDYNRQNFEYDTNTINDNEVIRVYHGFNSIDDAIIIAKQGMSGKKTSIAHKIYSYETGNNPYGLFVTVNMEVAKHRFSYGNVIMEFSTKVSDLEAPVWKGQNSFFGQGSFTNSFKDKEDRETQRLNYRDIATKEFNNDKKLSNIAKSDRPELANSLIQLPERQALYIGDLSPNMIKRFWVKENLITANGSNLNFIPLTRIEFIKKFGDKKISQYTMEKHGDNSMKLFYPNDELNFEKLNPMDKNFIEELKDKKHGTEYYIKTINNIIQSLIDNKEGTGHKYILERFLWPKQIIQAIGKEKYNQYFNRYI